MVQIEGFVNTEHLLRAFIENEYAFSFSWGDEREVRIAHHKGLWTLAKLEKNKVKSWFSMSDSFDFEISEPLLRGLVETLLVLKKDYLKRHTQERQIESFILAKILHIWGGDICNIKKFSCVQPCRNGSVDRSSGDFVLNPQLND